MLTRFPLTMLLPLALMTATSAAEPARPVGVARVDITPDYPVRLSGYGNRREETATVEQRRHRTAPGRRVSGTALLHTLDQRQR